MDLFQISLIVNIAIVALIVTYFYLAQSFPFYNGKKKYSELRDKLTTRQISKYRDYIERNMEIFRNEFISNEISSIIGNELEIEDNDKMIEDIKRKYLFAEAILNCSDAKGFLQHLSEHNLSEYPIQKFFQITGEKLEKLNKFEKSMVNVQLFRTELNKYDQQYRNLDKELDNLQSSSKNLKKIEKELAKLESCDISTPHGQNQFISLLKNISSSQLKDKGIWIHEAMEKIENFNAKLEDYQQKFNRVDSYVSENSESLRVHYINYLKGLGEEKYRNCIKIALGFPFLIDTYDKALKLVIEGKDYDNLDDPNLKLILDRRSISKEEKEELLIDQNVRNSSSQQNGMYKLMKKFDIDEIDIAFVKGRYIRINKD